MCLWTYCVENALYEINYYYYYRHHRRRRRRRRRCCCCCYYYYYYYKLNRNQFCLKVLTLFHLKALLTFTNYMRTFEKLTTNKEHSRSKQNAEINSLISENFTLEVVYERYVVTRTFWYTMIMLTILMHFVEQEMFKSLRQNNINIIWHW